MGERKALQLALGLALERGSPCLGQGPASCASPSRQGQPLAAWSPGQAAPDARGAAIRRGKRAIEHEKREAARGRGNKAQEAGNRAREVGEAKGRGDALFFLRFQNEIKRALLIKCASGFLVFWLAG